MPDDVFAAAAAALHADTALSVVARYRARNEGAGVDVRVIRSSPSADIAMLGQPIRARAEHMLSVLRADVTPDKGDTFTMPNGDVLMVLDRHADAEQTTWSLGCRLG